MDNISPNDDGKNLSTNDPSVPLHDSKLDSPQTSNNVIPSSSERIVSWNPVLSLKTGVIRSSNADECGKKSPLPKATASRSAVDEATPYGKTETNAQGVQVFVEALLKTTSPFINLFSSVKKDGAGDSVKSQEIVTPTNGNISPSSGGAMIPTKEVQEKHAAVASKQDQDTPLTEIEGVLETVFLKAPLMIVSRFVKIFYSPNNDESTGPPRTKLNRSVNGRSSQHIFHEVVAQQMSSLQKIKSLNMNICARLFFSSAALCRPSTTHATVHGVANLEAATGTTFAKS
jgi:hypothetical protein